MRAYSIDLRQRIARAANEQERSKGETGIDVAHLFPDGQYVVKVVKAGITKVDLKQQLAEHAPEQAIPVAVEDN
ncbi:MAG: hypothetical protein M3511_02550 [Deinococcota bacterium]|jgi:hypothetical protein|nr:hypothetical protein [Deinococcota bacterium]